MLGYAQGGEDGGEWYGWRRHEVILKWQVVCKLYNIINDASENCWTGGDNMKHLEELARTV